MMFKHDSSVCVQVVQLITKPQLEPVSSPARLERFSDAGTAAELFSILDQEQAALLVQVQTYVEVDGDGVSILERVCQVAVFLAEESCSSLTRVYVVPDVVLSYYLRMGQDVD